MVARAKAARTTLAQTNACLIRHELASLGWVRTALLVLRGRQVGVGEVSIH
jgi:hypothetical protein